MQFYVFSILLVSTVNLYFCRGQLDYENSNYSEEEINPYVANLSTTTTSPIRRKCFQTKLSFKVTSFQYTWHIDQLVDYMDFSNKFNQNFQIKSTEVRYDAFDGYWIFSLDYNGYDKRLTLRAAFTRSYTNGNRNSKSDNIEILCNVIIDEKETSLSTQRISSTSHTFEWRSFTDVMNSSGVIVTDATDFVFTIKHFTPNDPSNKVDDRCSNDIHNPNKKLVRKTDSGPPFTHNLHELMDDEKYIDVIIKTKNSTYGIQAHRIILAKTSPVLATLVYNSTYDKNESIIDMQDTENDIAEKFVRYIYTGQVDEIEKSADRLIVLADVYAVPDLKVMCEHAIVKNIGLDNALKMYSLGMQVASPKITKRAFTIMKENKAKLASRSDEFRLLSVQHPNLMFELFVS